MSCGEKFFVTLDDVKRAKDDQTGNLINNILYEMCKKHPNHKFPNIGVEKIWLIGRAYAASIERRRSNTTTKTLTSDEFYERVKHKLSESPIDDWLDTLRDIQQIENRSIERILTVHGQVTKLFCDISGLEKRSLASKYLHFHFPNLFFIFDNWAKTGLAKIKPRWMTERNNKKPIVDREYETFFKKTFKLRQHIKGKWQYNLSPREIDKLLLDKAKGKK